MPSFSQGVPWLGAIYPRPTKSYPISSHVGSPRKHTILESTTVYSTPRIAASQEDTSIFACILFTGKAEKSAKKQGTHLILATYKEG